MGEFIRGKQLAAAEITNRELAPAALSADATGRAIVQTGFFDSATVLDKFATASIADAVLAVAYIKQDGTRAFTGNQDMGGNKLTGLANGTSATDAVSRQQLDSVSAGLDPKASSRAATTAALAAVTYANGTAGVGATLTANANGALAAQDGVTLIAGDRLLVKNQASAFQNGIYTVTQVGSGSTPFILTRSTDNDSSTSSPPRVSTGNFTFIEEGSVNGGTGWVLTTALPITMGTTNLVFSQFSTTATLTFRNGLVQTGNFVDVVSPLGSLTSTTGSLETTFATPATKADAAAATAGSANSSIRSDAKLQVDTGTPLTTIQSDAGTATTGTDAKLLRRDAQLLALTAAPGDVGTANAQGTSTSLTRADHTHRAAFPTRSNKHMAANNANGDNLLATATTLVAPPAQGSWIDVKVNGTSYSLADGNAQKNTRSFYFSADGGTTAKALSALIAGDSLYFNKSIAGFKLDTSDLIDLGYETYGAP